MISVRDGGGSEGVKCPRCYSVRFWRDGKRKTEVGLVQRYICKICGRRFSGSVLSIGSYRGSSRQVCDTEAGSKNLTVTKGEELVTGDKNEAISEYEEYLRINGIPKSTIESRIKYLKNLHNSGAKVLEPESVKRVIAEKKWRESTKEKVVDDCNAFFKFMHLEWEPPRYSRELANEPPLRIVESEIDQLISGSGPKTGTQIILLKETACRRGEIKRLKWEYVNFDENIISIPTEKRQNPRMVRLSKQCIDMVSRLPRDGEYLFMCEYSTLWRNFERARMKIYRNTQNPRFRNIKPHDIRKWKVNHEYRKYHNDINHVCRWLGGEKPETVMNHYLYGIEADYHNEWDVKIVETKEECAELLSKGYDYVMEKEDYSLFRRPV